MFDSEQTPPVRINCTVSLVLYRTPPQMLRDVLKGLPASVCVTIIDNSPTPVLQPVVSSMTMVAYKHAGENLGYGAGHNLALKLSPPSEFHLVINPDIIVEPGVLERMLDFMKQHPDIGLLSPRFQYEDGTIQYLNRRLPTVLDIVLRHLPADFLTQRMSQRIRHHEMRDVICDTVNDVECMSGAFMLCRRDVLEEVGGFDPRYFMYFEDFDLCCSFRMRGVRTACWPAVSVMHRWERASGKEIWMTLIHIRSMILFFNKWGWRWY